MTRTALRLGLILVAFTLAALAGMGLSVTSQERTEVDAIVQRPGLAVYWVGHDASDT